MLGQMMDRQLTIDVILERGGRYFPDKEIVTREESGIHRYTFHDFYVRSKKLANALTWLGVEDGERVATFCWNHYRHLELYFGIPITGAVLHTVNIRLFADQIIYIFNHAEDRVLFVDRSLFHLLAPSMDKLPLLKKIVLIGEGADPDPIPGKELFDYEDLIKDAPDKFEYQTLDENRALGLCYTSGTTGEPKGVLYSHRSTMLHSLGLCLSSTIDIKEEDVFMPVVPQFHANAWGTPYACIMIGAKIVMPGPNLDPESLIDLIRKEGVTYSAGVPTIWNGILTLLDENPGTVPSLKRMAVGGSAAPRTMIRGFKERHDIEIIHIWGMTEISPAGTVCTVKSYLPQEGMEYFSLRATQGLPIPLVEVKAIDEDGQQVAWDGEAMGELVVRGPWIAASYFKNEKASEALLTDDGWMRTGDIVTFDKEGYMRIMDRTKDLIKSGGEWISSVDVENALMAHPEIAEAAVIAKPDPKWTERPFAFVVAAGDKKLSKKELDEHMLTRIAKWQLPDDYLYVAEVPKTSVGKFDKKSLRTMTDEKEEK